MSRSFNMTPALIFKSKTHIIIKHARTALRIPIRSAREDFQMWYTLLSDKFWWSDISEGFYRFIK